MKRLVIGILLLASGVARAQGRTGTNPAEADTQRCQKLFEDGEFGKAEAACTAALNKDSSYVDAWRFFLYTLLAERKEDKVITEAERAENTLGIRDPRVLALHGTAIFQLAGRPAVDPKTHQPNKWAKRYALALPLLERAASTDSSLIEAQAPLCLFWMQDRAYVERSSTACQAALKQQPTNQDLLISQAYIYLAQRKHAEATSICDTVKRLTKKAEMEYKANTCIGIAQVQKGDLPGARRTLEPLQKYANKGGAVVDKYLTLTAETQQEADKYGLEYMRLKPEDADGPLYRAQAYIRIAQRKRPADAAMLGAALNDLFKAKGLATESPKKREITRARASTLSLLGRFGEAASEWKPIYEETGPSDAEVVLGYGVAARKAGDNKVAIRVLEAGNKKHPDNISIKFELGRTLVESGELSQGVKYMEQALAADEGKDMARRAELVNVLVREGVKLARLGKSKEAEALLERGVHYDPNSVIANRDLGLVRLQQRRYADAVGPLQVWRAKTVKDRDSNLILGRALAGIGKRDEAIKAYETARDAAQRAGVPLPMAEVLIELSPLYVQAGKYNDAVAAIEIARDNVQATMSLPNNATNAGAISGAKILDPVVRRNRALAYLARGYDSVQKKNADAGVADLTKALEDKSLDSKERANATCALALGYLGAGKAGQAVTSFQQAQKGGGCEFKSPYDKLGLDYWIAYARYREGTPAGLNEALKVFARAQSKVSGEMAERFKEMTFTAYMKLMAEEYARGNMSAAMSALKNAQKAATAVKDEVRKRDLQHNLAVLDLAQGKTAQAKQQLEQLGARPPEALVNLGLIYERQGDIQKALQLWQQSGRGGKVREWVDATRRFLGSAAAAGGGQP